MLINLPNANIERPLSIQIFYIEYFSTLTMPTSNLSRQSIMKLSLTAIAALFATTLHSSVATGTRAAASNGNTNAAEDKPHRDLEGDLPTIDLGNIEGVISGVLGDFDETMDEAIGETTVAAGEVADGLPWTFAAPLVADYFTDSLQTWRTVECIMDTWGEQVGAAWGIWLTDESKFGWFYETAPKLIVILLKSLANEDNVITADKLFWFIGQLPETKLTLFASSIAGLCPVTVSPVYPQ